MQQRQVIFTAVALISMVALVIVLQVIGTGGPRGTQAQDVPVTLRVAELDTGNPNATCNANGQVMMRISVEGARDLAALQFDLQFHPAVTIITGNSVAQGTGVPHGWLYASNHDTPGILRIGMVGFAVAAESFAVADVTFDCAGSAGQATDLTFANIVAGDLAEDALPSVGVNGSISIAAPEPPGPTR